MGATLSEPETEKKNEVVESKDYKIVSTSMQGWRRSMEDRHLHMLKMPKDKEAAFFAVFDGHGGDEISKFCAEHLPYHIGKSKKYKKGKIEEGLIEGFLACDEDLRKKEQVSVAVGTTATTALLKDGIMYVANVGDSRCVACIDNGVAKSLTDDDKADKPGEKERIEKAGGFVEGGRINGKLGVSRAFGDFQYKAKSNLSRDKQEVVCTPRVTKEVVDENLKFVLLYCDGISEVKSNDEVVDFFIEGLAAEKSIETVNAELMESCMAKEKKNRTRVGYDNMTIVVLCFLHGNPFESLVQYCKSVAQSPEFQSQKLKHDIAAKKYWLEMFASYDQDAKLDLEWLEKHQTLPITRPRSETVITENSSS